jgi:hypothetical protein
VAQLELVCPARVTVRMVGQVTVPAVVPIPIRTGPVATTAVMLV